MIFLCAECFLSTLLQVFISPLNKPVVWALLLFPISV